MNEYTAKMDKLTKFKLTIHKVLSDESLLPKIDKNNNIVETYCNIGTYLVLHNYSGDKNFWNTKQKRIMTANEMNDWLNANKQNLGNNYDKIYLDINRIYIASIKGERHGHIAVIYPSRSKVYTGKWNCYVPLVANIGKENAVMGLNWAFGEMPEIFDLGEV